MLEAQVRAHQEAQALERVMHKVGNHQQATQQQALAAIGDLFPIERDARQAAWVAFHEAQADMQEARHSLKAHEAADASDAEAWAERWGKLAGLVKAHEQRVAKAEQIYQTADATYNATINRAAHQAAYAGMRDFNALHIALAAEEAEDLKQFKARQEARDAKMATFFQERLRIFVDAGVPLAERLASGLFRID
jgi:hypothetical protein